MGTLLRLFCGPKRGQKKVTLFYFTPLTACLGKPREFEVLQPPLQLSQGEGQKKGDRGHVLATTLGNGASAEQIVVLGSTG